MKTSDVWTGQEKVRKIEHKKSRAYFGERTHWISSMSHCAGITSKLNINHTSMPAYLHTSSAAKLNSTDFFLMH